MLWFFPFFSGRGGKREREGGKEEAAAAEVFEELFTGYKMRVKVGV